MTLLSQFEIQEIDQTVLLWLNDIRQKTIAAMQQPLDVHEKRDNRDLVTNVDQDNEKFINDKIRHFDAEAHIVSEEGFGDHNQDMNGRVWFVDPIDGTMNFVKQKTDFGIIVAPIPPLTKSINVFMSEHSAILFSWRFCLVNASRIVL